MTRRARLALSVLFAILVNLALSAGAETVPGHYTAKTKVASGYFATVSRLCVYDDFSDPQAVEKFEQLWRQVKDTLYRIEELVSVSLPGSEIARFNQLPCGEAISVSADTAALVELARQMCEKTNGYYDPTVYPLVDLWGFSPRFTYGGEVQTPYDRQREGSTLPAPDPRYIRAFRQLVGMEGIVLEADGEGGFLLRKQTPSVTVDGAAYQAQLDLGGIAKGYACDLVTQMMREAGYEYGFFSCGSSSISLLKNASASAREKNDPAFQLEVRKPRETLSPSSAYARVRLAGQSLSSSGDYGGTYLLEGDVCCHIVNPFTGYPLNVPSDGVQKGICTVTLLSGSAAEDDAYTTALCLMGPQGALEYLNSFLPERDWLMVLYRADQSGYQVLTNLDASRLTILDEAYGLFSRVDGQGRTLYTGDWFDPGY